MRILIVGAGLTGTLAANVLQQSFQSDQNIEIIIADPALSSDSLSVGTGIALPANAMLLMQNTLPNIAAELLAHGKKVNNISYKKNNGTLLAKRSLTTAPLNLAPFIGISYHNAIKILRSHISANSIIKLQKITSVQEVNDGVMVIFADNNQDKFDLVIAADGIHSTIRTLLFPHIKIIDLGVTTWRFVLPYSTQLDPDYLFANNGSLFMAYPIGNGQTYYYAHITDKDKRNYCPNKDKQFYIEQLQHYFKSYDAATKQVLEKLSESHYIHHGRIESLTEPSFGHKRIVMAGDAAHPCAPTLQQGFAQGLIDILTLTYMLNNYPIDELCEHYTKFRLVASEKIMAASNNPYKLLANITFYSNLLRDIVVKLKGPLNVAGWKKILNEPSLEIQLQQYR